MPYIVYRSIVSLLFDPKGSQRFIQDVLNARDLESEDPLLGSVYIQSLLKHSDETDIQIVGSYYSIHTGETCNLLELASLSYIMKALKPQAIFEIGTFTGKTTRILALNAPANSNIFTLDLSLDQVNHDTGEAFRNTAESKRITQLYGDSQTFDFSPWYNKCDFVWVDGCHDYRHVICDSLNAFKLCRPGGWIAWHDYRHTAWWSGVTRCVCEMHKSYPGLVHIKGTTIVVLPGKDS